MKLFRKKILRSTEDDKHSLNDKAAKGIVGCIIKIQNGFAKFMSNRTKNISAPSMKAVLIIFCLAGSSLNIYFILTAFLKKDQGTKMVKIDRMSVPKYYDKIDALPAEPDVQITKHQHEEMQAFVHYMDSLKHSKTVKHLYDSILLLRPRLLDSVNMLEEIYQSQNKK